MTTDDPELCGAIEETFDRFLRQEGARQRGWDFATFLIRNLAEEGWYIEREERQ